MSTDTPAASGRAQARAEAARTARGWLLAVVATAFLLRLGAALTIPLPIERGDAVHYDRFAASFAEHGALLDEEGGPMTYRPPGYPVFVGAIYALAGRSPTAVAVVQAVLDTGVVVLMFVFLRERYGALVAGLTAGLYALSPAAIFAAGALLSESIGTAMLLVAVGLTIRAGERGRAGPALAAGLVCSALTLTRSVMVLFPIALALSLLWCRALSRGVRARLLACLLAAYVAGLVPWLARNALAVGAPVLSTNGGATLYASWVRPPGHPWGNNVEDAFTAEVAALAPVDEDRALRDRALAHVLADPAGALALVPQKLAMLVAPWDWEIVGRGRRAWNLHWLLVLLVAPFAWRDEAFRRSHAAAIVVLALATLAATSVLFYGSPRFRAPFEPLLFLPAALVGARLRARLGRKAPVSAHEAVPE